MAESEELKSLLMKVIEEREKVGLKLNIQKTKIMASSPITSWQIDGETVETVTDFIFLGSKITADGDCSLEIKRRLLLGRKVMTKQDSVLLFATLWTVVRQIPVHRDSLGKNTGVAIYFSRGSSQPRNRSLVPCIAGSFFTN